MLVTGTFDFATGAGGEGGEDLPAENAGEPLESADSTDSFALLVDDDADCLRILRSLIESDGHRCLTAQSGLDALASCEAVGTPRFVVTDWNMPGLDGEMLARRLKDRYPALPIVLVTGRCAHEVPAASRESLFSAVLTKPLDPAVLSRVLSDLPSLGDSDRSSENSS